MIRGLYTGASGMMAQQHRLNAISNNLANVDTHGYKRDTSVHKAFPEMLLRRFNDDGVMRVPFKGDPIGSIDTAPVVGRLGTGVAQNEVYTIFEQGPLEETSNPFDLALDGEGFFAIQTPNGERYTRNGSFHLGPEGLLVTKDGFPVLGEDGPIRIKENNFRIDKEGIVFQNDVYAELENRLVGENENQWEQTSEVDRLRIVNVRNDRYLEKQGSSMWKSTWESGDAQILNGRQRPQVEQGFLETANVNPVDEMVEMIQVNRAYEANQRVIRAEDESTGLLLNRVLRL
ncbi:MAG: flagellar basal-body rod protein FlgF [Spirochaetes bacterium]|nr:flagellar basal-body rod protein FlgF [Spirochaetota bacterium]